MGKECSNVLHELGSTHVCVILSNKCDIITQILYYHTDVIPSHRCDTITQTWYFHTDVYYHTDMILSLRHVLSHRRNTITQTWYFLLDMYYHTVVILSHWHDTYYQPDMILWNIQMSKECKSKIQQQTVKS